MRTLKNVTLHDLTNDPERSANWAVVSIDETRFWRDDLAKKAGKIFGVYFVNLMEPTNLCDPQINYPATFLYNLFESTENFSMDELEDIELDCGGDDFQYKHEYTLCSEAVPSYMPDSFFEEAKEEGENWEEAQIDYYKGNHVI